MAQQKCILCAAAATVAEVGLDADKNPKTFVILDFALTSIYKGCENKNMAENLAIIASIPLFNGLPPDQLEAIRQIAVEKRFGRGETIFCEGDVARGFCVVIEGRVKVYKVSTEGKEQILHIFGPCQPFGEVPVFTRQKFPAYAESIAPTRVLFFPRTAFVELITANPSLALNMLAVMSTKLQQFTVIIENLSLKEVPARLASYLLYLAGEQEKDHIVTLNISKGLLASILGTIPETLSRIFAKLSTLDLIRVEGRQIRLLDREGLEEMAEYGRGSP